MEKFNVNFVFGIISISLIVGMLIGKVGDTTSCTDKPVGWTLPLGVLFILGTIFIFGLYGRKK